MHNSIGLMIKHCTVFGDAYQWFSIIHGLFASVIQKNLKLRSVLWRAGLLDEPAVGLYLYQQIQT